MTSDAQVLAARRVRNEARDLLSRHLAQVQEDAEARGIGGRIADRIGDQAREVVDHALEIADENPGVIAGTIAALTLWFLRHPIATWLDAVLQENDEETDDADQGHDHEEAGHG